MMSYEYKDYFKELNFNESRKVGSDLNDRFNARDELNEVYSQAAKADEYEAKAKAWDKYKAHMESHIAGEVNEEEFVSDLKSDYFESGESNAKK